MSNQKAARVRISTLGLGGSFLLACTAMVTSQVALSQQGQASLEGASAPAQDTQWGSYNNRLNGQRFSALAQVTPQNADSLHEICRLKISDPTAFSSGIIVVDGTIFVASPHDTVALDATDCSERWRYTYKPEDTEIAPSTRGTAVMDGKVFRGTGDGRLLAIDAASGKLLWKVIVGDPRLGEFAASAPLATHGVVYMGIAGGDRGIRGRVMAYNATDGRELWRFNTIPMGNETGAASWKRPETAKTGGGGVWGAMSYDVTTNELFVPVGNPWPDIDISYRPGENLFSNSIVVLDGSSGALKWWFQATPQDQHDMDLTAAPILYRDSKIRDVMALAGKDGYLQVVDRSSHKLLFKSAITRMENEKVGPTPKGTHICPGFAGGTQWNGPALDQKNGLLITGAVDWCMTIVPAPTAYSAGRVSYGGRVIPDKEAHGWIVAVDSETGAERWRFQAEKPVVGGITPTAGGVTFAGDMGGSFMIFDSASGRLLKRIETGGAIAGGVVTYAISGKQYVAITSGNVSRNTWGVLGTPSVIIYGLGSGNASAPSQPAATPRTSTSSAPASLLPGNATRGAQVFAQVCAACHGPTGDSVSGHDLKLEKSRRDISATIAFIKNPNAPMPKLFPEVVSEQQVVDVATYIREGLR